MGSIWSLDAGRQRGVTGGRWTGCCAVEALFETEPMFTNTCK